MVLLGRKVYLIDGVLFSGAKMLFNSLSFFIFFPIVAILYFVCTYFVKKNMANQVLLLAASLYFYACWNPLYLCLIVFSVLATWWGGLALENKTVKQKRIVVALVIFVNLMILFFFKYYNFFCDSVDWFAQIFSKQHKKNILPHFSILLPVGISFYTFQALGYMIDVYRGDIPAERNFVTYALFVTFFPQLVAGPIERSRNLLPQFKTNYRFDYDRVTSGMRLFAWGLFKKIVIADQVALYVNSIYGAVNEATGLALLLATFFFAFQIWCDFSGYSDMAIGVAKILGFHLMKNFDRPYTASSIVEFWRRWHISLSTWFKDYLYIPLGGNRCGKVRRSFNLMITFVVSGLWHGAAWHFVAWGFAHGLLQIISINTASLRKKLRLSMKLETEAGVCSIWKAFQMLVTFILVILTWMLFRVNTMSDVATIWNKFSAVPSEMLLAFDVLQNEGLKAVTRGLFGLGTISTDFGAYKTVFAMLCIGILFFADWFGQKYPEGMKSQGVVVRWACYWGWALVMFYFFSSGLPSSEFIYFQF